MNKHLHNLSRTLKIMIVLGGLLFFISACSPGESTAPLTFRPELFTRQDSASDEECVLIVETVEVSFPYSSVHDAMLHISGIMTGKCSNLQVGMDSPDVGKNIQVEIAASTTSAAGGNARPFEVELVSKSLRVGKYTVWVNGVDETIFSVE